MHEIIEHTADIGIHVTGLDLDQVFTEAAEAMFKVMMETKPNLIPSITVPVQIERPAQMPEGLKPVEYFFIKWLQELLYVFETRHLALSHFYVDEISDEKFEGYAKGLPFDRTRHKQKCQIKAVTYHKLSLEEKSDGWHANVIFDI